MIRTGGEGLVNPTSQYDIFEILPDGAPIWKGSTEGQDAALLKLESLCQSCQNELIIVHLPSSRVVARRPAALKATIGAPGGNGNGSKRPEPEKPAN